MVTRPFVLKAMAAMMADCSKTMRSGSTFEDCPTDELLMMGTGLDSERKKQQ
jgi:hypothetical protein